MSGGAMNYTYTNIEYECVGKMGDRDLDDLMKDVAKLVHDREWNLSGDTCDETYAQSVRDFKTKWFETPRKDRLHQYINDLFNKTHAECLSMIGAVDTAHAPLCDKLVCKYGESVNKTVAGKILGVTRMTVYAMLKDGRLQAACQGKRVSVQSIASYMSARGAYHECY